MVVISVALSYLLNMSNVFAFLMLFNFVILPQVFATKKTPLTLCADQLFQPSALIPFFGHWTGKTISFQNGEPRGAHLYNMKQPGADNMWLSVGFDEGMLVINRKLSPEGDLVLNLVELFGTENTLWLPMDTDFKIEEAARGRVSRQGNVRAIIRNGGQTLEISFELTHVDDGMDPKGVLRLRRTGEKLGLTFDLTRNRSQFTETGELTLEPDDDGDFLPLLVTKN